MTSDKKKEYDRNRAKELYEDYKNRIERLRVLFGNKCWSCGSTENLQFHHIIYQLIGKLGHASMWRRIKHIEEIENNPENFKLLCGKCHQLITILECNKTEVLTKLLSIINKIKL